MTSFALFEKNENKSITFASNYLNNKWHFPISIKIRIIWIIGRVHKISTINHAVGPTMAQLHIFTSIIIPFSCVVTNGCQRLVVQVFWCIYFVQDSLLLVCMNSPIYFKKRQFIKSLICTIHSVAYLVSTRYKIRNN